MSSIKKGADYVEIDVWMTKSGKLICQHDTGTTRKFTSINKELADYDDSDLTRANLASGKYAHMGIVRIPTLEEVLSALPSRIKVEIDCKSADEPYFEKIKQISASTNGASFLIRDTPKRLKNFFRTPRRNATYCYFKREKICLE